jgi:thioester reductase-like protein
LAQGGNCWRNAFKESALEDAAISVGSRIVAIAGDIVKPRLGLDEGRYQELAREVDIVLHNAAAVNFVKPYEEFKLANVDSVRTLLALCAEGRRKAFHFVSTMGLFGAEGYEGSRVTEASPPHKPTPAYTGYVHSKWVAEQILELARARGFSVTIHRPSLVTGDSKSGHYDISNRGDLGAAIFQLTIALGTVPDDDSMSLWVVPVDQAARRIVAFVNDPVSRGHNCHITDWPRVSMTSVPHIAAQAGFSLELAPFITWMEQAKDLTVQQPQHPSAWLVQMLADSASGGHELSDKGRSLMIAAFDPPRMPPGFSRPAVLETQKALAAALRWLHTHGGDS